MITICRHIKTNGQRCGSPALRDNHFCYYHDKIHNVGAEPHLKYGPLQLPAPEDPASVQLSVARINDAVIHGKIDLKMATTLLYGLQVAAQYINRAQKFDEEKTVQSAELTVDGDEIAPDVDIREDGDRSECSCTTPVPDTRNLTPETCFGGKAAKTGCETLPAHLTHEDSTACSHQAARVQPLCNCTAAVRQT